MRDIKTLTLADVKLAATAAAAEAEAIFQGWAVGITICDDRVERVERVEQ